MVFCLGEDVERKDEMEKSSKCGAEEEEENNYFGN